MRIKTISIILLQFLFVIVIIDPTDKIFGLKVYLFTLFIFSWIIARLKSKIELKTDLLIVFFIFYSIPLISFISGLLQGQQLQISYSLSYFKTFVFFILLFPITDLKINSSELLIKASFALVIITIVLFIFFYLITGYESYFYKYLVEQTDTAKLADREFLGIKVKMIFYNTSPILIYPLCHYLHKFLFTSKNYRDFVLALLFLACLMVSGTRANALGALLCMFIYCLLFLYFRFSKIFAITLGILLVFVSSFLYQQIDFGKQGLTSEIKNGHFVSYKKHFRENPATLVLGQGIGSSFFSKGFERETYITELTFLDLIRVLGIPLFTLFIVILFIPFIRLLLNGKLVLRDMNFYVPYIAYLFIAGTNPLLISSTGFLVIVVIFDRFYKSNYTENVAMSLN